MVSSTSSRSSIVDGVLVLWGPGVFQVSDPVGQMIVVAEGDVVAWRLGAGWRMRSEADEGTVFVALWHTDDQPVI